MALIDVRCTADPEHEHEVYRPAADWPKTPPCPTCGEPTEQYHPPPRTRWSINPIVVYQADDGSFRFPGDANGAMSQQYRRMGYKEVELRNSADVRRFENQVNANDRAVDEIRCANREAMEAARTSELRGELRQRMQSMSRFGRDTARAAMDRNDGKPRERPRDTGFHVEVMSMDRSNREASRDEHGRRRRD